MHHKHKANTGKEMAAMVVVKFALGKLLLHDTLHAERQQIRPLPGPARSLSGLLAGHQEHK
jgi:hypothetical protein